MNLIRNKKSLPERNITTLSILIVFVILEFFDIAHGIKWLSLGKESVSWLDKNRMTQCALARKNYGFARQQVKICRTTFEVMPFVVKAAEETVNTCQQLFKKRRWNCSTILTAPDYSPDLTTGTREQAFVYALSSSAIAYTTSKACASGNLFNCSCSSHPKIPPHGNFKWGGCGDNIRWGLRFGKRFTDSLEKAKQNKQIRGRTIIGGKIRTLDGAVSFIEGSNQTVGQQYLTAAINIQNYRVGRKVIETSLTTHCKCHGVSGSCSIKICWRALPKFLEIGEKLQNKYKTSFELIPRKLNIGRNLDSEGSKLLSFNRDNLIFTKKSPDYCLRDAKTGSLGTQGRLCNRTSQDYDSCEIMCCGRGHITLFSQKIEMCKCKFHWCCNVACKKCLQRVIMNICN